MALNLWLLLQVVSSRFPWVKAGLVHKKINLVESTVAWEHERYSLRRIPSFTLSHLEDPKSELRGSILDTMWVLNSVSVYYDYEMIWKDDVLRHISVVFVFSHRSQVDIRKLKRNGIIIAEALARYMYNLSDKVNKCMKTECMYPNMETVLSSFVLFHFIRILIKA